MGQPAPPSSHHTPAAALEAATPPSSYAPISATILIGHDLTCEARPLQKMPVHWPIRGQAYLGLPRPF